MQALRDLQLANDLEARAIRLRKEATSHLILCLGGTEAGGFVKFMIDTFGGSSEFEKVKAQAVLQLPTGDDNDPEDLEAVLFPAEASGSKDDSSIKDFCLLKDAKVIYPTSDTTLSATGVPAEFISDNVPSGPSRQSTYYCLFSECGAFTKQKVSTCTHTHRKHLEVAIGCKFCGLSWWSSGPFTPHMTKKHPEIDNPNWWTPLDTAAVDKKEAEEAAAAAKELPTSS